VLGAMNAEGARRLSAPLLSKLLAASLFWLAVLLIQKFDWGLGVAKASVLVLVLGATPLVLMFAERRHPAGEGAPASPLVAAGVLLLVLQTGYAIKEVNHRSLIDAATTTLEAGEVLRGGANPYAAALDPMAVSLTGSPRFGGYKYLPVTIAAYLPLGMPFGTPGVVITNLLLQWAVAWLVFRLATRMAGTSAGWLALVLYLALPLVAHQLFAKGVPDLVAVLPVLAALLVLDRRPGLAGFWLGLSLAAKPLPGALLLACCLPAGGTARFAYAKGIALGLLPIVPFLLWSPAAIIDNVLRFNLVRPPDSTSWLAAAPPEAGIVAHAALALLYGGIALAVWRHPPSLLRRAGASILLILTAMLAAPVAHHNYQLWWLPLAATVLAAALAPDARPAVYEAPTPAS
jgi:hypothetical protein